MADESKREDLDHKPENAGKVGEKTNSSISRVNRPDPPPRPTRRKTSPATDTASEQAAFGTHLHDLFTQPATGFVSIRPALHSMSRLKPCRSGGSSNTEIHSSLPSSV